ncbi:acetate--CoA ligase family protein [Infirmifilum sp. SLHALR2]
MTNPILEKAINEGRSLLSLSESLALLESYGLPVARYITLKRPEEAAKAVSLGFPVVLKLDSPDIVHKTEAGAVRTGIGSEVELRQAMDEMLSSVRQRYPEARVYGFVVQEMVQKAHEVIIGGLRDEQFGPVIAFGIGGILVEVLKDVVFEIAPVSYEDALEIIKRIKGYRILEGYRGLPRANIELLAETISRASLMFSELSTTVSEMDLNPTFVSSEWVKIADARFKLSY